MEPQPIFYDAEAEYRYDGLSDWGSNHHYFERLDANGKPTEQYESVGRCRYGAPGDRLWVKEAWGEYKGGDPLCPKTLFYRANYANEVATSINAAFGGAKWKSPMLMPRRLSRITLEITNVRCERVKSISAADAIAEGYESIGRYIDDWNSLNEKRGYGWETNPYVWVVSFEMIEGRNQ